MTNAKLKENLLCRSCGASWKYEGKTQMTKCPHCDKKIDARDRKGEYARYDHSGERKEKMVEWSNNLENRRRHSAKYRELLKKRAFFKVCGSTKFACAMCGCDDARLLEINHKNGGGSKEIQKGKLTHNWYTAIANGTRSVDDLELLCRPCNAIHYLEMKYGKLPMRIVWGENEYL